MSYLPRTMRFLLLALPVLALLPQVIPDYGAAKRCLKKSGQCRKSCKDGEISQESCKYSRVCCIVDTNSYKQRTFTTWTTEETSTIEYDLSSDVGVFNTI
ncbi:beta-defensin 118-like [Mastomys coucha]|uniref:beta-defensin 118-like n=1 Tax=Mastomys coucha TaxID=35658 RepID=UPI0012617E74|nr:beta-defensin 118-like [Mastomys coucha]